MSQKKDGDKEEEESKAKKARLISQKKDSDKPTGKGASSSAVKKPMPPKLAPSQAVLDSYRKNKSEAMQMMTDISYDDDCDDADESQVMDDSITRMQMKANGITARSWQHHVSKKALSLVADSAWDAPWR